MADSKLVKLADSKLVKKRALVVKVLNNVKNNINNIDLEPRTVDYAKYIEAFDDVYEYFNMAKKRNHQFDEFFTGVEWPAAPGELTKYLYSTRKRTALLKMISNVVGFVDTCVDVDMLDCLYQLSNGIGCVVSLTIGIGVVGAGSSCGAK
uniref:Apoptosis regulator BAX-like n=1 Tax=Meloidogyne hapla TaxID=6305 RepID=A0A1I8BN38_MELHA